MYQEKHMHSYGKNLYNYLWNSVVIIKKIYKSIFYIMDFFILYLKKKTLKTLKTKFCFNK